MRAITRLHIYMQDGSIYKTDLIGTRPDKFPSSEPVKFEHHNINCYIRAYYRRKQDHITRIFCEEVVDEETLNLIKSI